MLIEHYDPVHANLYGPQPWGALMGPAVGSVGMRGTGGTLCSGFTYRLLDSPKREVCLRNSFSNSRRYLQTSFPSVYSIQLHIPPRETFHIALELD